MSAFEDMKRILEGVRGGQFAPVYLLHGEESFFIDVLAEAVEQNTLAPEERDFNQTILYGRDVDHAQVIDACKRYPMMADRQLVVVRELQTWRIDEIEKLVPYLLKPTPTTVLLLVHRHKKVDGRRSVIKSVQKGGGTVFVSEKVREDKVPDFLVKIAKKQKRKLAGREAQLLADHLGSDLAKAVKEVEKLCLVTEENGAIDADAIQRFVGISKDHNVFELQQAIGTRDALRAQRIAQYFAASPKDHPIEMTMGFLNGYFTKLAIAVQMKDAGQQALAEAMKVSPFFVRDYQAHARNYNLSQVVKAQHLLRQCDMRVKGLGGDGDRGEVLRELLARVME